MISYRHFLLFSLCMLQSTFAFADNDYITYDDSSSEYNYEEENNCCWCEDAPPNMCHPNVFSLGPEYYRAERKRQGGTKQDGNAVGVRLTYDYIKRYCFYIGGQAFFGTGILNGHTGSGNKIKSRLTDALIEGSVGYTFQMKCFPYPSITPYIGYGYFQEINKFISPSPLHVKFTTHYNYLAYGFLSSMYITPCLTVGLNARFRAPWQARCKVSNDPDFDNLHQRIGECFQYRIELPITYTGHLVCDWLEVGITPFFEQRIYGKRENYPFDFLKTRFNIYGANLLLIFRF